MPVVAHTLVLLGGGDGEQSPTTLVPWPALVAAAVAVCVALWNHMQGRRDRRRDLYSEAYKAVVTWAELFYRVRRRDPARPYEIVALFHDTQEAIDYHDGWLSIESPPLARSYRKFVREVKTKTAPAIQTAWREAPCDPKNGFSPPSDEEPPNISAEKAAFLADVNDHLSLHPCRRRALRKRYPETEGR